MDTNKEDELDGTLTRAQRMEVAQDVISRFKSRQRKFTLSSAAYIDMQDFKGGQFNSKSIIGACEMCARGALFLASVDRYNDCQVNYPMESPNFVARQRTYDDFGEQAELIEDYFEGRMGTPLEDSFRAKFWKLNDRRPLLIGICENIIRNNGEFEPELEPGIEVMA